MSAEEVLDEVVEVKRNYGTIAALVVGGGLIGAGITYFITDKIVSRKYEEKFDRELQESMEFLVKQMGLDKVIIHEDPDEVDGFDEEEFEDDTVYTEPTVIDEPLDPVGGERVFPQEGKTSLEDLTARNQAVQYNTPVPSELEKEPEEIVPEEPEYEDPDISVISRDIFMENPSEFTQATLTYFADAGVLDVGGDFVVDPTSLIGERKPPFGQMSEDANVVYLRNKRLEREFEVIFDSGNASDFATFTEGDDAELKHSLQALQEKYSHDRRR